MKWILVPVGVGHLVYLGVLAAGALSDLPGGPTPVGFIQVHAVALAMGVLFEFVTLPHIALVPAAVTAGVLLLRTRGASVPLRLAGAILLTAGAGLAVVLMLVGSPPLSLTAMWISAAAAVLTGVAVRRRTPRIDATSDAPPEQTSEVVEGSMAGAQ